MKKNHSKKGSFIIGFEIGLCMIIGLSTVNAGENALHEKIKMKWQKVALKDNDTRYDEEKLKKKLGVDTLIGVNLSGTDLRWIQLPEANLKLANLQKADLSGANLRKANLQWASLRGANLSRVTLEGTDIRGADLTGAKNLISRQVAVAIYDKKTKFPAGMSFGNIPKYDQFSLRSNLGVKTLVGAEAQGMILRWGDFAGADMQWSSLQRTDLTGANLSQANLSGANLHDANLWEVDLQMANLKNASLQGSNLKQANLRIADLTGTNLQGANLSGADLYKAKLQSAKLTEANLSGADLSGADLRGADLRGVKNITINQLAQAVVDIRTRLPEGITFKQIE